MQRRTLLIALTASLASGCGGWHLRGSRKTGGFERSVMVRDSAANNVGRALRNEISNRGGRVVRARSEAEIVLNVEGERYDRRILSIDPDTGKVREIELGLAVTFSARGHNGRLLIPREEASWENDYVFDEGSVLGTNQQDSLVRRELAELAAIAIALRLQAVNVDDLPRLERQSTSDEQVELELD